MRKQLFIIVIIFNNNTLYCILFLTYSNKYRVNEHKSFFLNIKLKRITNHTILNGSGFIFAMNYKSISCSLICSLMNHKRYVVYIHIYTKRTTLISTYQISHSIINHIMIFISFLPSLLHSR